MAVGLYAGSFDPIHRGHVDLIEAAVRCLDGLFVVVAGNPDKPNSLLSFDERRELILSATMHLPTVVVTAHQGLLVHLAKQLDVDVLVRSMAKSSFSNCRWQQPTRTSPVYALCSSRRARRLRTSRRG